MVWTRCASGPCRKEGRLACTTCKSAAYCSKTCQKRHWKKHKPHCSARTPMLPGVFDMLKLPREIRDKIYKALMTAPVTPGYLETQAALDHAREHNFPLYDRRNLEDELEERRAITPGTPLWNIMGFHPLIDARGLLCANKQLSAELTESLYANNIFLTPVSEYARFFKADQIFTYEISRKNLAVIRHLVISIRTELLPEDSNYDRAVACIKYNMNHIVKALNRAGVRLKTLKVRYISAYAGKVEKNRRDVDALLTNPNARPIHLLLANGRNDFMTRENVARFYEHSANIAAALHNLRIPVDSFKIHGDVSGKAVKRLRDKFGASVDTGPVVPVKPADSRTGQTGGGLAALMQEMALKNPGNEFYAKMAREQANAPIKSDAIMAQLMAPPSPAELEMIRRRRESQGP